MAEFLNPENVKSLKSALMHLIAGESVRISASDFRKLTGDEITAFCSEGRLMMGNLAASANCQIDTTNRVAVFTKKTATPVAGIWTSFSRAELEKAKLQSDKRSA